MLNVYICSISAKVCSWELNVFAIMLCEAVVMGLLIPVNICINVSENFSSTER